jgi:hypothetical protein
MPKNVGDDGVRGPHCFLRAEGDRVALLGIGESIIEWEAFSCGIFNWEDDGREKTMAEWYEVDDSAGEAACSESPLG